MSFHWELMFALSSLSATTLGLVSVGQYHAEFFCCHLGNPHLLLSWPVPFSLNLSFSLATTRSSYPVSRSNLGVEVTRQVLRSWPLRSLKMPCSLLYNSSFTSSLLSFCWNIALHYIHPNIIPLRSEGCCDEPWPSSFPANRYLLSLFRQQKCHTLRSRGIVSRIQHHLFFVSRSCPDCF